MIIDKPLAYEAHAGGSTPLEAGEFHIMQHKTAALNKILKLPCGGFLFEFDAGVI